MPVDDGEGGDVRPDADGPLPASPYGPSSEPSADTRDRRHPPDAVDRDPPPDRVADPAAGTDDAGRPRHRLAERLGLVLALAVVLAVLLTTGVVAVLTGLASLVPEDPPVTTAAGTLADPVPVGDAWRTFVRGAPELDIAIVAVDLDSDAAPEGLVAASDRVVAAIVRIESHGIRARTIDLVDLGFQTADGDLRGPRRRTRGRPRRISPAWRPSVPASR
ncbi:hypothetical protein [Clavibacter capsici]|uniref:hypothetical protein n=1 Tax=Clavibacter capsici TaxID=1874630 RepID=UPI0014286C14|nr:hypothetical protein [Clavibacter capsici]QIS38224.1 hypothetical protein GW572_01935 [Clavibacter capsici]